MQKFVVFKMRKGNRCNSTWCKVYIRKRLCQNGI